MKILGISGKIGAGKTTIADHLVKYYGFTKLSFSTPLKQAASVLFNIPLYNFYNSDLKIQTDPFWGLSPRKIMQKLGTECMRHNFGFDFWTRYMRNHIYKNQGLYKNIVIDDVRFVEEAKMIIKMGGKLAKVIRFDNPYSFKDSHVSENYEIPYEIKIINKSSIKILCDGMDIIMEDL